MACQIAPSGTSLWIGFVTNRLLRLQSSDCRPNPRLATFDTGRFRTITIDTAVIGEHLSSRRLLSRYRPIPTYNRFTSARLMLSRLHLEYRARAGITHDSCMANQRDSAPAKRQT